MEESVEEAASTQIELEFKESCFLVNGIYLQGAGWNIENCHLQESKPREVKLEMPVIRLEPRPVTEVEDHRTAKTESPEHKKGSGFKGKDSDLFGQMQVDLYSTKERVVRDEQAITFDPKVHLSPNRLDHFHSSQMSRP